MKQFNELMEKFSYDFPNELIAQNPASPRDSARLLVYDRSTKKINHDVYRNLSLYIPPHSVLVLNKTKVLPARIEVRKTTGGKARLLYISHDKEKVTTLSDKKLEVGSTIFLTAKLRFTVLGKSGSHYILKPSFPSNRIFNILTKYGKTPLPPYIKHTTLKGKKLLQEYNTVFAKQLGSVAAPTASLHFTKSLLNKLKKRGVTIKFVTLHVNMGTFAPLLEEQLKAKQLHSEHYAIEKSTADFLNTAKHRGQPIIAVGTTVVRTLESASNQRGELTNLTGDTNLFITEKSKILFVDQLITNFHVPRSSLLMLVSAFVGRKRLLALYKIAIQLKYRLFSFGDGMYIR